MPTEGTPFDVIGVAYDDVLNFRSAPAPGADVVQQAKPLDNADIVGLGKAWLTPGQVWWKVSIRGQEAWSNQQFLGSSGVTEDITDTVIGELGGDSFDSIMHAAKEAAGTRVSVEPASTVTFATKPIAVGKYGSFVYVDVVGLGDDAVKAERLRVEVTREGYDGVKLVSVEATSICSRGISETNLCR